MNIKEIVSKMTLEEKAGLCSGLGFWETKPVERLGINSIMMTDGPHGLRKVDSSDGRRAKPATCFPPAVTSACSFDRELLFELGAAIGNEAEAENVRIVLGPGVNIKRSPLCGRNFEYFSEDPYLAGEMAAAFIKGVQSRGIGTSLKHFAANNQETRRWSTDAQIDERTLREIYLPAFKKAVQEAKPATLMCAYNKLNGEYASENHRLLTQILRDEWGFDGFVMSDWGAVNDRVKGLKAGLELEMPGVSVPSNDGRIIDAVKNGELDEAVLDLAVERMLGIICRFGGEGACTADCGCAPAPVSGEKCIRVDVDAHNKLARRIAAESMVLLKNAGVGSGAANVGVGANIGANIGVGSESNGLTGESAGVGSESKVLPLKKNAKIVFIGELAEKPRFQGAGSSQVNAYKVTSVLEAVEIMTGASIGTLMGVGSGSGVIKGTIGVGSGTGVIKGTIGVGSGTGGSFGVSFGVGSETAESGGTGCEISYCKGYLVNDCDEVNESLQSEAVEAAKTADVCVIFAGLPPHYESEGYDREHMHMPEGQNKLIEAVVAANPNVAVVLSNGSPVEMPWADKVPAILEAYLGGQAGGGAVADILFGVQNPCGKLAETLPRKLSDNPSFLYGFGERDVTEYREGIFVGYRYYDTKEMDVRFPFGHGLSYTSFEYSNLKLSANSIKDTDILTVTFDVKNTGAMQGKEIAQIYVGQIDRDDRLIRAEKELRDFAKIELSPGEKKTVTVTLDKRAFSYYNTQIRDFHVLTGEYAVMVAKSSRDIPLQAQVQVTSTIDIPFKAEINTTVRDIRRMDGGYEFLQEVAGKSTDMEIIARKPVGSDDPDYGYVRSAPEMVLRQMQRMGFIKNVTDEEIQRWMDEKLN